MKSVRVSFGVTKNLGNYESARIDMEETTNVEDALNAEEIRSNILYKLQEQVNREASKLTGRR